MKRKVKTFITLDRETLREIDLLKINVGLKSRGEVIKMLLDSYKKMRVERNG